MTYPTAFLRMPLVYDLWADNERIQAAATQPYRSMHMGIPSDNGTAAVSLLQDVLMNISGLQWGGKTFGQYEAILYEENGEAEVSKCYYGPRTAEVVKDVQSKFHSMREFDFVYLVDGKAGMETLHALDLLMIERVIMGL